MNPLHLGEREVYFDDYQKLLGNGDWIGNLLEHSNHQNINFLVLGRGMSNLLEMLGPENMDIIISSK
jgi:hypothetical protein